VQTPLATTTTAPIAVDVVGGRSNETVPQYLPLPLTAGGASVAVSQVRSLAPSLRCNALRRVNCLP
jgi:hypothetical protein